jgi:hypothetical protein
MNVEEKQIVLGGKTYKFSDFSEKQQYILKQLDFIQREEEGLKMAIDRCMAVKKTFLDEWKKQLKKALL